jgi:hypothetical protein
MVEGKGGRYPVIALWKEAPMNRLRFVPSLPLIVVALLCFLPRVLLMAWQFREIKERMVWSTAPSHPEVVRVEMGTLSLCVEPLCSVECPNGNLYQPLSEPSRLRPIVEPASYREARLWRERLLLQLPTQDVPSSYVYLLPVECLVQGEGTRPRIGLVH